MIDICYPPGADWGCAYTLDQLDDMREKPEVLAQMERSEALAWMQLAALTADQIGACPITGWVNACGCAAGDCSCTALCEAILPGPVGSVVEILLDGAVLDPSAYRIDNGNRLVRTDGDCWPACQDMISPSEPTYEPVIIENPSNRITLTRQGQFVEIAVEPFDGGEISGPFVGSLGSWLPRGSSQTPPVNASGGQMGMLTLIAGQPNIGGSAGPGFLPFRVVYETTAAPDPVDHTGSFIVTYYQGAAPDDLSKWIAGLLAVEYFKACTRDKSCRLPNRLQSVARQGVTYQVAFTDDDGLTGVREVDDFVRRLNPFRLKMPPTITTPQTRRTRQTTWAR
jgi:hypothetical protein